MIASDLDIAIQALRTCLDFGNLFLLEYIKNFKAVPAINFTAEVEVKKIGGTRVMVAQAPELRCLQGGLLCGIL